MWRENDATRVAGPVFGIEPGIVFREVRIAGVAKDALNKIEIAHQIGRHKKPGLHGFLRGKPRHLGADNGPEKQGDKAFRGLRTSGSKGQSQQAAWRRQGEGEQFGEHSLRHGQFVGRNGKAPFGNMENALSRAPVAARVVEHPLLDAIGADDVREKLIPIHRQ